MSNVKQEASRDGKPLGQVLADQKRQSLENFVSTMRSLLELGDEEEADFKPTQYALGLAWNFLLQTFEHIKGVFPQPWASPEGDGGIRLTWTSTSKKDEMHLIIPSADAGRALTYCKKDGVLEMKESISSEELANYLSELSVEV